MTAPRMNLCEASDEAAYQARQITSQFDRIPRDRWEEPPLPEFVGETLHGLHELADRFRQQVDALVWAEGAVPGVPGVPDGGVAVDADAGHDLPPADRVDGRAPNRIHDLASVDPTQLSAWSSDQRIRKLLDRLAAEALASGPLSFTDGPASDRQRRLLETLVQAVERPGQLQHGVGELLDPLVSVPAGVSDPGGVPRKGGELGDLGLVHAADLAPVGDAAGVRP